MLLRMTKVSIFIVFTVFIIGIIYIIYAQKVRTKALENHAILSKEEYLNLTYKEPFSMNENVNSDNPLLLEFNKCYYSNTSDYYFYKKLDSKYHEIEVFFKKKENKASFTYEDLYSGLHVSYNEKQNYFCASIIKSPVVTYIYEMYLNGEISFDELMTYQQNDYSDGAGWIKFQSLGSKYPISELISRAIIPSDNVAYMMLSRRVNGNNIKRYWHDLGANTFWQGGLWGQTNSHDGAIYMKQLYKLAEENPEIRNDMLEMYYKSVQKLIVLEDNNVAIAHKAGWNSSIVHDIAVVYNKQPYVLAITTSLGYEDYTQFFKDATKLINDFHTLYWKEKENYCYDKILINKNN